MERVNDGAQALTFDKSKGRSTFNGNLGEFAIDLVIPSAAFGKNAFTMEVKALAAQSGTEYRGNFSCQVSNHTSFKAFPGRARPSHIDIVCNGRSIVKEPTEARCNFETHSVCFRGEIDDVVAWLSDNSTIGLSTTLYTHITRPQANGKRITFDGVPRDYIEGNDQGAFDGKIVSCQ